MHDHIKIDRPEWTSTEITFRLRNLVAADTYYYTVNEQAGRPVGSAKATAVPPPPGAKGAAAVAATERVVDIFQTMAPEPSGSYELRIYEASEIDTTTDEPKPDARPTVRSFQYFPAPPAPPGPPPPPQVVRLDRSASVPTTDEALSILVLTATNARSFAAYNAYVDAAVCRPRIGSMFGPDAYRRLREATVEFLESVSGRVVDPGGVIAAYLTAGKFLPYVSDIAQRFPDALTGDPCSDLNPDLLAEPFPVELLWCYYEEEAGLVQGLNHIMARFENRRVGAGRDPLARFDLNPLRPLRHILWSWVEDEVGRLTVRRRAAEYQFEYGLPMIGRAVPNPGIYVERRSRFLEAFHTLLYEAHLFFERDDDTTVNADGFPVYNALRDTHLVMSEGASNQFNDLATQARIEFLEMQWLLSRPEIRDFLGGKPMVPYDEPWMPHLDTLKSLYGWASASVTHFHELAVRGEQLLLTIRWGNWNSTAVTADSAKNWARTWRNQIQRYVHAYRAVSGVDLTAAPDATPPAYLLSRRAPAQARHV